MTDIYSKEQQSLKKWGNITAEVKLVASILKDINTFCKAKKCKPIFTIFPNVEDLTAESKLYKSYNSFQKYMLDHYQCCEREERLQNNIFFALYLFDSLIMI